MGLKEKEDVCKLKYNPEYGHIAATIVSDIPKQNGYEESEVINCVSLDNWVETNKISKIDFIKADIEGSERDMLAGAVNILKFHAPRLSICTYHSPNDADILERIILNANSHYIIEKKSPKLFAYVP